MEEKNKPNEESEAEAEQTEETNSASGETTTWDFSSEEVKEVLQPEREENLILFSSVEEEEKPSAPLLWIRQKKVLVSALICLCLIVVGISIIFSDQWITTSDAQQEKTTPVKPPDKPAHLILQSNGQTYDLDLKAVGYNGQDLQTVNNVKLQAWLDKVKKQVDVPVQEPKEKKFGDSIQPARIGSYMDTKKVDQLIQNLVSIINKPQTIPLITVDPTVTVEDLQKVDKKLIGSYTTHFDARMVTRSTNIHLASKAINNIIIMPGKTFSFNKVVGERTEAKGYKVAHVLVQGKLREGVGGGICQVSTTLYNSVDNAGLKIVERIEHSASVAYVPPGRDATVSWGGPDFRFKNNLNKPILIRIKIVGGRITVKTYTDPEAK